MKSRTLQVELPQDVTTMLEREARMYKCSMSDVLTVILRQRYVLTGRSGKGMRVPVNAHRARNTD